MAFEQHADKAALPAVTEAAERAKTRPFSLPPYTPLANSATQTVNVLLTSAVSGASDDVKKTASESLDTLRGNDVDEMMLAASAGADNSTRIELIRTLAARGARTALPALLAAATDPDETIRAKSFDALGVLGGRLICPRCWISSRR